MNTKRALQEIEIMEKEFGVKSRWSKRLILALAEEEITPQMLCQCVYESDCHAIEMIKCPSGEEIAIGGTHTQDRFKFCPYCGGRISRLS